MNLLNAARNNPVAPNRLSDVCMKLSILNGMLGGHVSELKTNQLYAEAKIFATAKDDGSSDTGANAMSRLGTIRERASYEKAEIMHKDLWKLISMAQTHIRAETDERKGM